MSKLKILLVDDNEIFGFIFKNMLKGFPLMEISVSHMQNGIDALEYLHENHATADRPDLLFVDINMPFMDGWEFLDTIAGTITDLINITSVYIVSSSTSSADSNNMRNYPFVKGYLLKPFKQKQIFDIIKTHAQFTRSNIG